MINYFKSKLRNYQRELVDELELRLTVQALERSALTSTTRGVHDHSPLEDGRELVVSLTTYFHRIHDVHLVIESLFAQSLRPNRIILWLDEEEYEECIVPAVLLRQRERGLEIRYARDMGPHMKLVPTLELCPEAVVITVDDDTLYPHDMVDQLAMNYNLEPQFIQFNRGNMMRLDAQGMPLPYAEWGKVPDNVRPRESRVAKDLMNHSPLAFPTGVGGVLYPAHSLHPDVVRDDLFRRLCPKADDLWFKVMALKQGTEATLTDHPRPYGERFRTLPYNQQQALMHYNNSASEQGNDKQLRAVLDYYHTTIGQLVKDNF